MSEAYKSLKAELRIDDISFDPWGTVMQWHFNLCEHLYWHIEEEVPSAWQFRPGMGGAPEREEYSPFDNVPYEDLVKFGNVLARYASKLRQAGKDY
jgi:hypothetical protein